MKSFFSKILVCIVSLACGAGFAFIVLNLFPLLPIAPDQPILEMSGIQKPVVLGFIPYWLLEKTSPQSLSKLNTFTYFGLTMNTDGTIQKKVSPQETEIGWHKLDTQQFSTLIQSFSPTSVEKSLLIHMSNEASISALMNEPVLHAQNLVNDIEPIMKQYQFHDLNLDIESFREASDESQLNMSTFLHEVKKQLTEKKLGTLTTELTVASLAQKRLTDPVAIGQVSDKVVLMAYDFRYTGSFISGAVAPIAGTGEKIEYDVLQSIKLATQVIPSKKIVLGIPLYGYEWETLSYLPESPVIPGTGKTATISRINQLIHDCPECLQGRDELTGSPYIILPPNEDSSIRQIYYEDSQSIEKKIDLAKEYQLGGIAVWAIGYEDEQLLMPLANYKKSYVLE